MVATTSRSDGPLLRFGRVERRLHWVNATLFFVLMATGAILYVGPLSAMVGRRELIRNIHVWSGVALPVPLVIALIGRHGARLRRDFGELNHFAPGEARWFRPRTRGAVRLGKFNPGQKLNAVFIGAAGLVMLATGSIMKWFSLFPIDWRTGATFVHDWFAFGIWAAVIAHVMFAFNDPVALGGMMRGYVSAAWARKERPRWYDEETKRTIDSEGPDAPR
jgi:formate dehydrogenase subunit gamma